MPFLPRYCDSEAILSKKCFVPVTRAGAFIWKNFHPHYRDLGREVRDLGNRDSPVSHLKKKSSFFRRKKRQSRGEISETDPARVTGPAHMKRPLSSNTCKIESGKSREDAIKARLE